MMLGGVGISLGLRGKQTNAVTLAAGNSYIIPPGNYQVTLGAYTSLQYLDPVTGIWRTQANAVPSNVVQVNSDGGNQRLANLTGCPVAAVITTALCTGAVTGIGTTATTITVTPSSGSSTWCPVIGGALSTTCLTGVTGSTPGAGYLFPPQIVISAPPPGGLQATAHATVTGGTLLAAQITIDNQGAGYPLLTTGVANAQITVVNDPRDTVGANCAVRLALTGTGQLTGLYPLNQGVPLTGAPTLAFSTGIAAATPIMNFTVTAYVSGTTGVTYLTGSVPLITTTSMITSAVPAWTNPIHEKGATFPRPARIQAVLSGSAITTTGQVIEDAGFGIQQAPTPAVIGVQVTAVLTAAVALGLTIGGITDTSWLQPI